MSKAKLFIEAIKLSTINGNTFINRMNKIADKYGCEFAYNDSRKSYSMYFSFMTPDCVETLEVRISDHYSGAANMNGIDLNYYVDDYNTSNDLLKVIDKEVSEFKKKYIKHWE